MADATDTRPQPMRNRPPFECIALVLQGGGALGAYQAGVFQALAEAGLEPDWISGISIGAFNSAIIAGNPPEARVEKLRLFWEAVTEPYVQWQAPFAWPGAAPEADTSVAPQAERFLDVRQRAGAGAQGRRRARLSQSMGSRPRAV